MSGLVEGHLGCSKELVFLHAFTVSTAPQLHHEQLAATTSSIVIILDVWSSFLIKKQLTLVYDLSDKVNKHKLCHIFKCALHESVAGYGRLGAGVHLLCVLSLLPVPSLCLHRASQRWGPAGESQTNCWTLLSCIPNHNQPKSKYLRTRRSDLYSSLLIHWSISDLESSFVSFVKLRKKFCRETYIGTFKGVGLVSELWRMQRFLLKSMSMLKLSKCCENCLLKKIRTQHRRRQTNVRPGLNFIWTHIYCSQCRQQQIYTQRHWCGITLIFVDIPLDE